MLGIGFAKLGSSIAGLGEVEITSIPSREILLTEDRSQGSNRSIDPTTKDYKFDSSGNMLGLSSMQQMVYLLMTDNRSFKIRSSVITDGIVNQITNDVYAALKQLTDDKLITINSVSVTTDKSRCFIRVIWTDELTNKEIITEI